MSRTGIFVIAAAGSMILLALAVITKVAPLVVAAALALGLTCLSFPKQMTAAGDDTVSRAALPNRPWVYRLAGAVFIAGAIALVVKDL